MRSNNKRCPNYTGYVLKTVLNLKNTFDQVENDESLDNLLEDRIHIDSHTTDHPQIDRPIVFRPIVDRQIEVRPIVYRPIVDRPIVDRPIVDHPIVENPIHDNDNSINNVVK